jgi:uracil-DNA glycosylase family 4
MNEFGRGFSSRIVGPSGSGAVGVMILGDAPGRPEDAQGIPFSPAAPAGSVLERAIRRLGMSREQFVLHNVVPSCPPAQYLNKLGEPIVEHSPWEHEAVEWGRSFLEDVIARYRPRAILALGNVATRATTGLAGEKLGVGSLTGFVLPSRYAPTLPCFHPSYLRRGKMSHMGVLMRAIKMAVRVAREGAQAVEPPVEHPPAGYIMTPTEAIALEFEREAREARYIAYDIETPYSTTEDSAEEAEGEHAIKSIQFSASPNSGIFFPWREPFIEISRRILAGDRAKLGWNNWRFDDPVLRANGVVIGGQAHDLMWAWHHNQPDLPRGLQFAAAQQGWPWPWKHLAMASPQFYGIVDVDVLSWMVA